MGCTGSKAYFDLPVSNTVLNAYHLVVSQDRAPELETYIHHVHLLVWVLSREEDGVPAVKLDDMLATSLYAQWGPSLQDMLEAEKQYPVPTRGYESVRAPLVQECIIDGIGGDRFVDTCVSELQKLHGHLGCNCQNGVHDVHLVGRHIVSAAELMPTVSRRDLLLQALDVLKELFAEEFGTGMCTSLCIFCVLLLGYALLLYFHPINLTVL